MSYSFQLAARELFNFFITANSCNKAPINQKKAARVLLYLPSHRQDNTHHSLCYTREREISSMGPPRGIDPTTYCTTSYSSTMELCVRSTCSNGCVRQAEHWLEWEISSMGPPRGIDPTTYCTTSYSSTMELCVRSTCSNGCVRQADMA